MGPIRLQIPTSRQNVAVANYSRHIANARESFSLSGTGISLVFMWVFVILVPAAERSHSLPATLPLGNRPSLIRPRLLSTLRRGNIATPRNFSQDAVRLALTTGPWTGTAFLCPGRVVAMAVLGIYCTTRVSCCE